MKKNYLSLGLAAMSLLMAGCSTTNESDDLEALQTYNSNDVAKLALEGQKVPTDSNKFEAFADNPFVKTADEPVSTFSVDADGASYAIVRRYLANDYDVEPACVRIEEFLNYFTFDYPSPKGDEKVAINAEVGRCPWNEEHLLLRLGLKGRELTADESPRANFVFLVDVSGSMASNDKLDLLKRGLTELLYQLNPDDRISLITYSGEVQKLLESTPVREASKIKKAISQLSAEGCTNGGEALKMAYEEALAN